MLADVLPTFTCTRAIANLWSICLGVNTFSSFLCDSFNGNIPFLNGF